MEKNCGRDFEFFKITIVGSKCTSAIIRISLKTKEFVKTDP